MNELIEIARFKGSKIFRNNEFIERNEVEKYRKKYKNKGIFVSAFRYEGNQPDEGKIIGNFYLDLDSDDIKRTQDDALEIVRFFNNKLGIPFEFISIHFSGNKGFHIEIDHEIFGVEPTENLPKIYRSIAEKLPCLNQTIDFKVYERRRLWRLENSQHEKSGLYKIPLTYGELSQLSVEEIKQLAKQPREIKKSIEEGEQSKVSSVAQEFYQKCLREIENKPKNITIEMWPDDIRLGYVPFCIKKILQEGMIKGERNATGFILSCFFKRQGENKEFIKDKLLEWNEKNKPPLPNREIVSVIESSFKTEKDGVGCSTPILKSNCDRNSCEFFNQGGSELMYEIENYKWYINVEKNKLQIKEKNNELLYEKSFHYPFWRSERAKREIKIDLYDLGILKNKKVIRVAVLRVSQQIIKDIAKGAATKTPKEELPKLLSEKVTLDEVHEKVSQIGSYPKEMLELIMATTVSANLNLPVSLWLMIVGVPSSLKTELTKALSYLPSVYYLDSMTQNPFVSGYIPPDGGQPHDLLPELDKKCFICRDYTTLFSLNEETVKKLLGEMVGIYDEEFAKYSPTRGKISYKSRFSHVGCITPAALNRHQQYINIIGPRFLFYRIPKLTEESENKGFKVAWNKNDRRELIKKAREYVSSYCQQIINGLFLIQFQEPEETIQEKLNKLAKLMSRTRGIVIAKANKFKNEEDKWINYYEIEDIQIEEPWRALLQLRGLGKTLALIRNKNKITEEEIETLKKVALSSMPVDRADALNVFRNYDTVTAKELAEEIEKSVRTAQRLLKELNKLKVLDYSQESKEEAREYYPVEEFSEIIKGSDKEPLNKKELDEVFKK